MLEEEEVLSRLSVDGTRRLLGLLLPVDIGTSTLEPLLWPLPTLPPPLMLVLLEGEVLLATLKVLFKAPVEADVVFGASPGLQIMMRSLLFTSRIKSIVKSKFFTGHKSWIRLIPGHYT